MPENSFHRTEKLKSRKSIGVLFESGHSVSSFPLKALWLERNAENDIPVRAGFTVSKRNFKRAVDRNLLKRRMREAYRLHKSHLISLCISRGVNLDIMFIYISGSKETYQTIENALIRIIERIPDKKEKTDH